MTYVLDSVLSKAVNAVLPFFPYTCSIKAPSAGTRDASGGFPAPTFTDAATGVRCIYEAIRYPITMTLADKKQVLMTHKVYLPRTSVTAAITDKYQIAIDALSPEGAITFKNPVKAVGAYTNLVELHCSIASLV